MVPVTCLTKLFCFPLKNAFAYSITGEQKDLSHCHNYLTGTISVFINSHHSLDSSKFNSKCRICISAVLHARRRNDRANLWLKAVTKDQNGITDMQLEGKKRNVTIGSPHQMYLRRKRWTAAIQGSCQRPLRNTICNEGQGYHRHYVHMRQQLVVFVLTSLGTRLIA